MRFERHLFAAVALLLGVAVVLVYLRGLDGPFVFDDAGNILASPGIRITELSFNSLIEAWRAREFDNFIGRPLAMVTFALNYYFAELDVFHYKVTNVAIHLATGGALYWLTYLLLQRHRLASPSCAYRPNHLPWLALAVSGLWLLHPLNLTSVLYVVQRMTSLSALFTVLGLIGYCLGREQIIQGNRAGFFTIPLSLALFGGLAVLCKENGVLVLPLAALVELAFYRFAADPTLAITFRRFWLAAILLPLIVAAAAVLLQHERWFGEATYRFRDFTLEERVLTQSRVLWFYLRLILLPDVARMGLFHDDFPVSHGLTEPIATLVSLVGVIGLLVAAFSARIRAPVLFFAIGWFLIGHSLESTVLPLEMVHEHRNYLPLYGILFALAYYVAVPHAWMRRLLPWRLAFLALFAVLIGTATHARSLQWQDESSLYTREVMNHPNSARAHTTLGIWAHQWGYADRAREHLSIASLLTPGKAEHFIRLSHHLYETNGHLSPEVLQELRRRMLQAQLSPVGLWAYEPLLLISRDDPEWHDRFIELYAEAISRPNVRFSRQRYEVAYRLLAENHAFRGRVATALEYYERARAVSGNPYYDIAVARLYADYACYHMAEALVANVRKGHPHLASGYQEQLREVEAMLNHSSASPGCAL